MFKISRQDVFGMINPSIDAHSLGMLSFAQVMEECGIETCMADEDARKDLDSLSNGKGEGFSGLGSGIGKYPSLVSATGSTQSTRFICLTRSTV